MEAVEWVEEVVSCLELYFLFVLVSWFGFFWLYIAVYGFSSFILYADRRGSEFVGWLHQTDWQLAFRS